MSITLDGTSGITAPAASLTTPLPVASGGTGSSTIAPYQMVLGTSVPYTSFTTTTYHDFTGIPSWVKKITVSLNLLSTNGASPVQIQLGAGSIQTTGYNSSGGYVGGTNGAGSSTSGLTLMGATGATISSSGNFTIASMGSNIWTMSGLLSRADNHIFIGAGGVTLSGTLDRLRLTTINGTDTFDAGSVNILYEGF